VSPRADHPASAGPDFIGGLADLWRATREATDVESVLRLVCERGRPLLECDAIIVRGSGSGEPRQSPVMTPHALDLATTLEGDPAGPVRIARTSDAYWTFIGPFGGASAATALRAVLEHPGREGDPLALTVNFCAPISRGDYRVQVRRTRANRSSQHWSVEFTQGESAEAVLTFSAMSSLQRS